MGFMNVNSINLKSEGQNIKKGELKFSNLLLRQLKENNQENGSPIFYGF